MPLRLAFNQKPRLIQLNTISSGNLPGWPCDLDMVHLIDGAASESNESFIAAFVTVAGGNLCKSFLP